MSINEDIERTPIWDMLSEEGKRIVFPTQGIVMQASQAKGKKINATIGQAFIDGNPLVMEAIADQVEEEEWLKYASPSGLADLRKHWQKEIFEENEFLEYCSLPIPTSGITHGLYLAGQMFLNPGDRLIVPDLMWGNYKLTFSHAEIDTYPLFDEGFNVNGLEDKLEPGKNVILLNFPNNPTGYTPTPREVHRLTDMLKEQAEDKKIVALIDDAYGGLTYDKSAYQGSVFGPLSDIHPNIFAVKLDGLTKRAYAWGLRVGFITYAGRGLSLPASEALENKTTAMIRKTISNVSNVSQNIALTGMHDADFLRQEVENAEILEARYNLVKEQVNLPDYAEFFTPLPFNSGYFMCVRVDRAEDVRKRLLEAYDTGVVSIGEDIIRIAYSSVDKRDIPELFENLYKACRDVHS